MQANVRRGKRAFWLSATAAGVVVAVAVAVSYERICRRVVTLVLLHEADRLCAELDWKPAPRGDPPVGLRGIGTKPGSLTLPAGVLLGGFQFAPLGPDFWKRAAQPLSRTHRGWLESRYFSPEDVLWQIPEEPFSRRGKAVLGVVFAKTLCGSAGEAGEASDPWSFPPRLSRELLATWARPAARVPAVLEAIFELVTSDFQCLPGLTHDDDYIWRAVGESFCEALEARDWQAIILHASHPREKVRAGSLLLLWGHRNQSLAQAQARRMLDDPSRWVRIAAAGILASTGDSRAASILAQGLQEDLWRVRWWCGRHLFALHEVKHHALFQKHAAQEPEPRLKVHFANWMSALIRHFPGKEWTTCPPADVALEAGALDAFRGSVGGRGCVVRYGRMAYAWGDTAKRADIASAVKPLYTHFLFRAIQDGRIASLDDRVDTTELRLRALNPDLGGKDGEITWRHLASQTSCYGVQERPGEAFDYSDFNMALFFDTLFFPAFNVAPHELDREVLHARLTDRIECQDDPTFFAFQSPERSGRMAISVRDHARIGLLYLRQGRWGTRTILPLTDVQAATTSPLPASLPRTKGEPARMIPGQRSLGGGSNQTDHFGSYSFAWWTNGVDRDGRRHWPDAPHDAYAALGHGGRRALVVIPSLDLVAAWNDAGVEGREALNEALKRLAAAVLPPTGGSASG